MGRGRMSGKDFLPLAQPSELVKTKACDPSKGCCPFPRFSIVLPTTRAFVLSCFRCLTLCDPVDCSSPGSSVHGVSRQEHWSGLPCSAPGDEPVSPVTTALQVGFFITESWGKPMAQHSSSHFDSCLHSCSFFLYACISFCCLFV